jgi:hypothetical protein
MEFVVQVCTNPRIRRTVVRITKCDVGEEDNLVGPPVDVGGLQVEVNHMEEINALTIGSAR